MWTREENSDLIKPVEIEHCGNRVIVRKNFVQIPETEERSAHFEFDLWEMSEEQYEVYKHFVKQIEDLESYNNDLADAVIELAELMEG